MKNLLFTTITAATIFALSACSEEKTEDVPEPSPRPETEPTVGKKIADGGAKAAERVGEVVDEGLEKGSEAADKAKHELLKGVDQVGKKMREASDKIDGMIEDEAAAKD